MRRRVLNHCHYHYIAFSPVKMSFGISDYSRSNKLNKGKLACIWADNVIIFIWKILVLSENFNQDMLY